jgi:hypothetical protein
MSTKNLPGGKGQLACKADNLTALWASVACYRDSFTFLPFMGYQSVHVFYSVLMCGAASDLFVCIYFDLLLFILTANGFLPGGSGTTVRHNTYNNTLAWSL